MTKPEGACLDREEQIVLATESLFNLGEYLANIYAGRNMTPTERTKLLAEARKLSEDATKHARAELRTALAESRRRSKGESEVTNCEDDATG